MDSPTMKVDDCALAFAQISQFLESRMEDFKHENKRSGLSSLDLSITGNLLRANTEQLSIYPPPTGAGDSLQVIAATFRCLRNSCVACAENQALILHHTNPPLVPQAINCLLTLHLLLKVRLDTAGWSDCGGKLSCGSLVECLLVGVQFLGNYYSGHDAAVDMLWCDVADGGQVLELVQSLAHLPAAAAPPQGCGGSVEKLRYAAAMLLYNLLISPLTMENVLAASSHHHADQHTPNLHSSIHTLLQLYISHHYEWGFLLTGHLFNKASYLYKCFHVLPHDVSCQLLSILESHLPPESDNIGDNDCAGNTYIQPSPQCIQVIAECLLDVCHTALVTQEDTLIDTNPFYHSLLNSACVLSSGTDHCAHVLRENGELMEGITDLVVLLHKSGSVKQSEVGSTADVCETLERISLNSNNDPAVAAATTTASSKSLVIRLIANLVFRHTYNQNVVRERQGIPVILESCQLTHTDPFLREWCVYAVRNLCEGNAQNQDYVSSVQLVAGHRPTSALHTPQLHTSPASTHPTSYKDSQDDVKRLFH